MTLADFCHPKPLCVTLAPLLIRIVRERRDANLPRGTTTSVHSSHYAQLSVFRRTLTRRKPLCGAATYAAPSIVILVLTRTLDMQCVLEKGRGGQASLEKKKHSGQGPLFTQIQSEFFLFL